MNLTTDRIQRIPSLLMVLSFVVCAMLLTLDCNELLMRYKTAIVSLVVFSCGSDLVCQVIHRDERIELRDLLVKGVYLWMLRLALFGAPNNQRWIVDSCQRLVQNEVEQIDPMKTHRYM